MLPRRVLVLLDVVLGMLLAVGSTQAIGLPLPWAIATVGTSIAATAAG